MTDSKTLDKVEAPQGEHPTKEKAEKQVDIRKKPDMKELEALIAAEEGTAPKEQATNLGQEEGKTEVEKKVIPDRYKGKTTDELIAQLEEKENYIQSRSDEMGKLKKEIAGAEEVKKKIQEIEEKNLIQSQYANKIPPEPAKPVYTQDEFYENPIAVLNKQQKYVDDLQNWNRKYLEILSSPILDMSAKTGKEVLYTNLEEKYKEWPVKFDRKKVQEFLDKNPEYFDKYKLEAYEKAYHDTSTTEFSQKSEALRLEIREQEKKKLLEEMNTQKQAGNIGMTDLNTQPINPSGSSPAYDEDKMEEDPEYRDKVLADMKKRNRR